MVQRAAGAQSLSATEPIDFTANPAFDPAESSFGFPVWKLARNRGATAEPVSIQISASQPTSVYLSYDLHETEVPNERAEVQVTRKLYKLELQKPEATPEGAAGETPLASGPVYAAMEVQPGMEIDASALYLDEVVVSGEGGAR